MLRQPAVSGRFYPSHPSELASQVRNFAASFQEKSPRNVSACLVPHAGYMYSGHVAGAVYGSIALPKEIILLGVRHYPRGEAAAILSEGAWRTPLGDAAIDATLAAEIRAACPLLREDSVAHSGEHSLEVQLPFLQVLGTGFTFVPIALGTVHWDSPVKTGEGLGPAVAMLTAMRTIGAKNAEVVKYATSADVSGDKATVVGYVGMTFA